MSSESRGAFRILIADDSEEVTSGLKALLEPVGGLELLEPVHDGEQALKQIRALRPDGLILDLRMPMLTGLDVLRQMRQEGLRPITIVFTNYSEGDYGRACKELGAHYFVSKPNFDQVVELARHFHHGAIPTEHLDRLHHNPNLDRPYHRL